MQALQHWSLITVCVLVVCGSSFARRVLFNNSEPRLDIHGQIIDAHDGSIQVRRRVGLHVMWRVRGGITVRERASHSSASNLRLAGCTTCTPCSMVSAKSLR
jgi:hypothetical protein